MYWNNNTHLTTEKGIRQRQTEAKYLFAKYGIDVYRCDGTDGNVLQAGGSGPGSSATCEEDIGYWQTKGFYEFVDWCYTNIPRFALENRTGGSRLMATWVPVEADRG